MKNKKIHKITIIIGIVLFFSINVILSIRMHSDTIKGNLSMLGDFCLMPTAYSSYLLIVFGFIQCKLKRRTLVPDVICLILLFILTLLYVVGAFGFTIAAAARRGVFVWELWIILIFWILADVFILVKVIYLHSCKKEKSRNSLK